MMPSEFADIARIHCAAFHESGLPVLGEEIVAEYYRWQLARVPGATPLVVCSGQCVGGYAVCGDTLQSTARFMMDHAALVLRAVLRRPSMIADRRFIRFVTYAARVLLPRRPRPGSSQPGPIKAARRFWVEVIAVDPTARGYGLGSMLLRACEDIAAAQGFTECFLAVDPRNTDAVRLYHRRGWESVPHKGVWKGRMRKTLVTLKAGTRSTTYSAC
jgi:GNAT superfamily N-acetyltransferase